MELTATLHTLSTGMSALLPLYSIHCWPCDICTADHARVVLLVMLELYCWSCESCTAGHARVVLLVCTSCTAAHERGFLLKCCAAAYLGPVVRALLLLLLLQLPEGKATMTKRQSSINALQAYRHTGCIGALQADMTKPADCKVCEP